MSALLSYNQTGGQDLDADSLVEYWEHYQNLVEVYQQFDPKWIDYTKRARLRLEPVDAEETYEDESDREFSINVARELLYAQALSLIHI